MTDARINHLSFQLDGKLRYDRPISNLDRSITFEWLPRFASQGHTCDQHDTECRPANTHACPREHRIRIASTLKYPKARRLYDAGTLCSPVSIDEKVAIESIDNIGWTAIAQFAGERGKDIKIATWPFARPGIRRHSLKEEA